MLPSFLLRLRNRLLADPKFLAFAQSFPLTRPVARRKSLALFDLLAGFSYSQVLFACVELRVLQHVGQSGLSVIQLSEKIGLVPQKAEMLVRAAVALDILDRVGNQVILGSHGAAMLGQPWILRFVDHHRYFYRDLENPVSMLQGNHIQDGLRSYWSYSDATADKSIYSDLMAASQQAVSTQILRAYDFHQHHRILDVGGGSGAFLKAVGGRNPHLELNLFDLPGVTQLAVTGQGQTLTRHSGDFARDPLPTGMDIITLVRVVHDHDDDVVLALLRNIRKVCLPTTTLIIAEPFAGQGAAARVTDAYFNLYFLAMGQGKTRTASEIAVLALEAGFAAPQQISTDMPLITGLMTLHLGESKA